MFIYLFKDFDISPDAGASIRKIINLKIEDKLPQLEEISDSATKEVELHTNLVDMIEDWKDITFPISVYKNTNMSILGSFDDIQVRCSLEIFIKLVCIVFLGKYILHYASQFFFQLS